MFMMGTFRQFVNQQGVSFRLREEAPPRPGGPQLGVTHPGKDGAFGSMERELDMKADSGLAGGMMLYQVPNHKLGFEVPSPVPASIVGKEGDLYQVKLHLSAINPGKFVSYKGDEETPTAYQAPVEDVVISMDDHELRVATTDVAMQGASGGAPPMGGMPPMGGAPPMGGGMGGGMGAPPMGGM